MSEVPEVCDNQLREIAYKKNHDVASSERTDLSEFFQDVIRYVKSAYEDILSHMHITYTGSDQKADQESGIWKESIEIVQAISKLHAQRIIEYIRQLKWNIQVQIAEVIEGTWEDQTYLYRKLHEVEEVCSFMHSKIRDQIESIQLNLAEVEIQKRKRGQRSDRAFLKDNQRKTLGDWIGIAIDLGVYKKPHFQVRNEHPVFYAAFSTWSREQEDPKSVRRKMYAYDISENAPTPEFHSLEDLIEKAKISGVYQKPPSRAKRINSEFFRSSVSWIDVQENPQEVMRKVYFTTNTEMFSELTTIEEWKDMSKKLGVYGMYWQQAREKHSQFYKEFTRWILSQSKHIHERKRIKIELFHFENRGNPATIEEWIDLAKEKGVYKLYPTVVQQKSNLFYRDFLHWVKYQENQQALRSKIFCYFEKENASLDVMTTTISIWQQFFEEKKCLYIPKVHVTPVVGVAVWNEFLKFINEELPLRDRERLLATWFPVRRVLRPKYIEEWESNFQVFHFWDKVHGPRYTIDEMKNHSIPFVRKEYAEFVKFCSANGYKSHDILKYFPRTRTEK